MTPNVLYLFHPKFLGFRLTIREDAVPGDMMAEMKDRRQELIGGYDMNFFITSE